jgi:CSLREA domain-containing protein
VSDRQQQRRARRRRKHSERTSTRRLVAAGGLTAGATLAMAGVAQAAPEVYTVGTNADSSSGGNCTNASNTDCSLREAISLANANPGNTDTIVFNSNLTGSTITLTSDQLSITEGVAVAGPGASDVTLSGNDARRLFSIDPTTPDDPVSISGLTLTDGHSSGNGGAVSNQDAALTISDAVISDSDVAGSGPHGGGIFTNYGSLTINFSTVSGNHAYQGGGIGSEYGEVSLTDSTVTGNYADGDTTANGEDGYGGGIWTYGADVNIARSTIDNNVAGYDGGGIYSAYSTPAAGSLDVLNSTIANNQALNDDGGGVWFCCGENGESESIVASTVSGNTAATETGGLQTFAVTGAAAPLLQNSIVSGNTSGTNPDTDDLYAPTSYEWEASFDLIGVPSTYVNETVADSNIYGVDPLLGTLADNGGPTRTMKPLCGSPVLDQGMAFSLTEDQRGETRPIGLPDYPDSTATGNDGSDIGAVELQSTPGTACASPSGRAFGSRSVDAGPSPTQTVTLTNAGTTTLNVSTVALVGANPGEFTISSDTCAGASVAAGASCTVGVAFDPSSVGAKSALLRFTDDSLVTTQNVLLTGTGLATPPPPVTPANPAPTPAPTHKKKCKKKKHKRTADSAKKKKCKKKKKK